MCIIIFYDISGARSGGNGTYLPSNQSLVGVQDILYGGTLLSSTVIHKMTIYFYRIIFNIFVYFEIFNKWLFYFIKINHHLLLVYYILILLYMVVINHYMVLLNIFYYIFIIIYYHLLMLNKLSLFIGTILFIHLLTFICNILSYLGGELSYSLATRSYSSNNDNGSVINNSKYIYFWF